MAFRHEILKHMAKSEVEMGAFSKWVAGFDNNLEDYYIERPQNK